MICPKICPCQLGRGSEEKAIETVFMHIYMYIRDCKQVGKPWKLLRKCNDEKEKLRTGEKAAYIEVNDAVFE